MPNGPLVHPPRRTAFTKEIILAFQGKTTYCLDEQTSNTPPKAKPMSLAASIPSAILDTVLG
jgi:hypothetical protein